MASWCRAPFRPSRCKANCELDGRILPLPYRGGDLEILPGNAYASENKYSDDVYLSAAGACRVRQVPSILGSGERSTSARSMLTPDLKIHPPFTERSPRRRPLMHRQRDSVRGGFRVRKLPSIVGSRERFTCAMRIHSTLQAKKSAPTLQQINATGLTIGLMSMNTLLPWWGGSNPSDS